VVSHIEYVAGKNKRRRYRWAVLRTFGGRSDEEDVAVKDSVTKAVVKRQRLVNIVVSEVEKVYGCCKVAVKGN
jgi:hypothetical protein